MLAALFHMREEMEWKETLIITEPLFVFFAFVCLSPGIYAASCLLISSGKAKLALYHTSAAIAATALWIAFARQSTMF